MDITLNNGQVIEVEDIEFHKYWKPQRLYNGNVFVIAAEFDKEYKGYVITYSKDTNSQPELAFFWHETIAKYGVRDQKVGYFGDKEFYRILIEHQDGRGKV